MLNLLRCGRKNFLRLLKKYRNHPSLLFWTVNNEMKFYDNDNDLERAKRKVSCNFRCSERNAPYRSYASYLFLIPIIRLKVKMKNLVLTL